ncbi:MAG: hypothetical protein V4561_12845 [Bacteroidota bacterium]
MTKPLGVNYSLYTLLLCFALMAYSSMVFYPRWQKHQTESTIAYDVEGYYWYLPSVFIYKDLKKQGFMDSVMRIYKASGSDIFEQGFVHKKSGNYVLKYTSGMAILYLPAFVIGHLAASALGYPADGFSTPYQLSLQIWGLAFAFIGLYHLRKLLLLYYADKIVAVSLFLLVFGSNYLNYAAIDVGMSHSWLFTLYVFLLLNTHNFYKTFGLRYILRIGFIIGLLTLIRPTEAISVLIPLLWGVNSFDDLKNRFALLYQKKGLVFVAALCAFSVVFIQLFYWYTTTGDWIVYSYQDQGFNFKRPHAFVYSWSYKAGWLRYSPMLLFCFAGFLIYLWRGKNKFAVMLFFMCNYYLVSAWNIWDYGGFSGRAMIQSYPILIFTMATLIETAWSIKTLQVVLIPAALLFLYINIWWTYQAHRGGLVDALCTTKEYYWKSVGRWSVPERYEKLKDTDELFESEPGSLNLIYQDTTQKVFCVDEHHQDKKILSIPFRNTAKLQWIRASADFQSFEKEWNVWKMPQFIVEFRLRSQIVKTRIIRTHRFLNDFDQQKLFIDVRIPEQRFDSLSVSYWNGEGKKRNCLKTPAIYTF